MMIVMMFAVRMHVLMARHASGLNLACVQFGFEFFALSHTVH